jgi:hypothetical protein
VAAEWKTASMANFLPAGTTDIITTMQALTSTVTTLLDAVTAALNVAKTFNLAFSLTDFLGLLAQTVEDFKNDFLATGLYVCNMWDYPIKQLQDGLGYGPTNTYGVLNLNGHDFTSSFAADLANSFTDTSDTDRPRFTTNCAMLVLVVGAQRLDDLNITVEEGSISRLLRGFGTQVNSAAKYLWYIRFRTAWYKMKQAAQNQSTSVVAARVERVANAFNLFSQMQPSEWDALVTPFNNLTGDSFFENDAIIDLDWDTDILPVIEAVENRFIPLNYPDWSRATLNDVHPDLTLLISAAFDPIIDLLQSGSTITSQITALIQAIEAKITYLTELISDIDDILEQIEDMLNATGFHGIFISTSNGVSGLRDQLLNANNPFTANGFYSGVAIVSGSAGYTTFKNLFQPIVG